MKITTLSCLLAALCSASNVLADAIVEPASVIISDSPTATPEPELVDDEQEPHLEVRQGAAVANPAAATVGPLQYPVATTQWLESTIAHTTTWIAVAYTQTFASVPDQLPTAGVGKIGYGSLKKEGGSKRDVPVETDYVRTIVLVLENEVVTEWVQPVEQILILHTTMVTPNTTAISNSTTYGGNTTSSNATASNATAVNITNISTTLSSRSMANDSMSTGLGFYFY